VDVAAGFGFSALGFFGSRLLLFCPLAMVTSLLGREIKSYVMLFRRALLQCLGYFSAVTPRPACVSGPVMRKTAIRLDSSPASPRSPLAARRGREPGLCRTSPQRRMRVHGDAVGWRAIGSGVKRTRVSSRSRAMS
jgi:hypothetical protein